MLLPEFLLLGQELAKKPRNSKANSFSTNNEIQIKPLSFQQLFDSSKNVDQVLLKENVVKNNHFTKKVPLNEDKQTLLNLTLLNNYKSNEQNDNQNVQFTNLPMTKNTKSVFLKKEHFKSKFM